MTSKFIDKKYDLEEDEMQDLVNRSKDRDEIAQFELLAIFNNFLTKYIALLYENRYDLKQYDVRQFISFYSRNTRSKKHVAEVMNGIHFMTLRYCEEEDIRQMVQMAFLECIYNYERRESKAGGYVPFSGYIYNYFKYILKRYVDEYIIDQLGRKTFPLITPEEAGDTETQTPGFREPLDKSAEDLFGAEVIDAFWVAGDTCLFPFDQLTVQERQMLKWRYVDGLRSSEIAYRITEHQNTCRERFNRIKEKIKYIVESQEE